MIKFFVEYTDGAIFYETDLISRERAEQIFNEQIKHGNLANLIQWQPNPKYPDDEQKGFFKPIYETFKL